jgi:uncharacterized protein (DUF1778 family)
VTAKALRAVRFPVRLTRAEKRIFSEAAAREHLSTSAWIRLAGLNAVRSRVGAQDRPILRSPRPKEAAALRETLFQLRLTEEEKRTFATAAEMHRLSISAWLRSAGAGAARSRRSALDVSSFSTLLDP